MAEMGIAVFAPDFGPGHEEAPVFLFHDIRRLERFGEAGPPGPGLILVLGAEERLSGNDVDINPFPMVVPVFILEGRFGALFLGDFILQRSQCLP
jgi:hypothetical protein